MLKRLTTKLIVLILACSAPVLSCAMAGPKPIDIPAGDLIPALEALATQAQIEIVYRPDQLRMFRTRGVKGTYDPEHAVRLLLRGIPLELRTDPSGAMAITALQRTALSSTASSQGSNKSTQEGKTSSSDGFRLAQATSGVASQAAPVAATQGEAPGLQPYTLQEVVVTAQKRTESLRNVPISMSVLTGNSLDQSTFSGTTEALSTVPGVATVVAGQNGGTQLTVRGVTAGAPLFAGSSPIAYYVDSMPFGLVRDAIVPDADTYDLQRVEVLRGPQGTLYGASALNGVVRILTNDADLDNFDVKLRALGSYTDDGGGNYRGDMAINVPIIDGKLGARAVLGYEHDDGWIDSPKTDNFNYATLKNARLKVNAQPTDELSISLEAWHTDDYSGAPSIAPDNFRVTTLVPEPISTSYDTYGLKVAYQLPAATISSSTSYLTYANGGLLDGTPAGIPIALGTDLHSRVFSEELLANSRDSGSWHWSAGAFYRDGKDMTFQSDNRNTAPYSAFASEGSSDYSKSYALFGEVGQRFLAGKMEWTLGLRYFHDDVANQLDGQPVGFPPVSANRISDTFDATTPRAVLTWRPWDDSVNFYASYSQGFRSGFVQGPGTRSVVPDFPSVKPDKLNNFEIGSKGVLLGDTLSYDAAVYYIKWDDIQQTLTVPGPVGGYLSASVNGTSASGPGVDLSIATVPVRGFKLAVNGSWNDLKEDADVYSRSVLLFSKGQRINYSPEYTAGATAEYSFSLGAAGLEGKVAISEAYTSEMDDTTLVGASSVALPGDPMSISRLRATVAAQMWSVTAFVDNLANDRGTPFRSPLTPEWDVRVPPRTVGMQVDYHFR